MLAKATSGIPREDGLAYEPKWDGFRCIVFRDGDEIELGSRNTKPLTRYFPELVEALRQALPQRCVVDGEIVISSNGVLDFELLSQRVHPAASRIQRLSQEIPASFVAFDILALDDRDLTGDVFSERRQTLESAIDRTSKSVFVTPMTRDPDVAEHWFNAFEAAGLDGVVAKALSLKYVPDKRVMRKIKHERTADCVVAGFRWHKSGPVVGSLLLGLYDDDEVLHHVGITAAFTMVKRKELVSLLEPHRVGDMSEHPWRDWSDQAEPSGQRQPGAPSRWNAKKDMSWEPLDCQLVCEVAYDHLQGERFRHATSFKRWRTDRDAQSCTYSQLERPAPSSLAAVLSADQ
jgi:ATP-dependent DNA ligase